MINKTLAIAIAAFGSISATQGALLFYEGFDYTDGAALNGTGGWTASSLNIEGSVTKNVDQGRVWNNDNFVGVTQTGLFAGGNNGVANLSLASTVTDTFTVGSTTWMSWLSIRVDFRHPVVAIGTGTFGGRAETANGQNIGGGNFFSGGGLDPSYWDPAVSSGAHQTGSSEVTIPLSTFQTYLVMARIDWAADESNDTVTLAAFASGDTISEAAFDAKVTAGTATSIGADLDQSTFDTLNVATSRDNYVDEIRIATTFADAVTGTSVIPEPGSFALVGLGALALLARRRR